MRIKISPISYSYISPKQYFPGGLSTNIYVDGCRKFEGVAPPNRSGGVNNLALGIGVLVRCENKCTGRAGELFYEFSNFSTAGANFRESKKGCTYFIVRIFTATRR